MIDTPTPEQSARMWRNVKARAYLEYAVQLRRERYRQWVSKLVSAAAITTFLFWAMWQVGAR